MSKVTTMKHDDTCEGHDCQCAVREMGWVAREARGLSTTPVPDQGSPERVDWQARWDRFTDRKTALMVHVEATR